MSRPGNHAPIEAAETAIAVFLRVGVLACAGLIGVSWAASLLRSPDAAHGTAAVIGSLLRGEQLEATLVPRTPAAVWDLVAHGDPIGWAMLGLMLLIALPILRVALTVVVFLLERDWVYVALAGFVLAVLVASTLLGKAL